MAIDYAGTDAVLPPGEILEEELAARGMTQKELALLEYLMRNAGRVLTRAMIAEQVWDVTWDRMTNVIDVFINHLRKKLEETGEPRLIHSVRGVGYVLRSDDAGAGA